MHVFFVLLFVLGAGFCQGFQAFQDPQIYAVHLIKEHRLASMQLLQLLRSCNENVSNSSGADTQQIPDTQEIQENLASSRSLPYARGSEGPSVFTNPTYARGLGETQQPFTTIA